MDLRYTYLFSQMDTQGYPSPCISFVWGFPICHFLLSKSHKWLTKWWPISLWHYSYTLQSFYSFHANNCNFIFIASAIESHWSCMIFIFHCSYSLLYWLYSWSTSVHLSYIFNHSLSIIDNLWHLFGRPYWISVLLTKILVTDKR